MWTVCTKWKNLHIPHCEKRDSRGSRTSDWLLVQNCTSLAMSRLCWAELLLQGDGTTATGVENQPRQRVRGVTEGALRPLYYKGRRLLSCGCWLKPSFISKKHLTGGPRMIVWRKSGHQTVTRQRWAFCRAAAHTFMSVLHRLIRKNKEGDFSESQKSYKFNPLIRVIRTKSATDLWQIFVHVWLHRGLGRWSAATSGSG